MALSFTDYIKKIPKSFFLLAFIVLVIASFFRLYQIGQIPAGMSWDEAAIGYNGSAIWKTRRDEWLIRLPVSFKSFGDFKAPLAIYINGGFTTLIGLKLWVVRLPFALTGIATVVVLMAVIHEVFRTLPGIRSKSLFTELNLLSLLTVSAGVLVATSPWHIHFSRAGFESGMALFFVSTFIFLWLFAHRDFFQSKTLPKIITLVLAGASASLAMYAYHSAKVAIPVLFIVLFFTNARPWKKRLTSLSIALVAILVISFPMLKDILFAQGAERFHQTSVLSEQIIWLVPFTILKNIWAHFSLQFLVAGQTTTLRHGDGNWGVMFISELMLLVISGLGLLAWLRKKNHESRIVELQEVIRIFLLGLGIIISGLMPAAIGTEIPHANRVLLAYPGFLIFFCLGIFFLHRMWQHVSKMKNKTVLFFAVKCSKKDAKLAIRSFFGMIILFHFLFLFTYWHDYQFDYKKDSAEAFQYGYEQAFQFAIKYEDSVDKIVFTSKYGQPYIYAIFFRKTNPIWYQGGSLVKYEFSDNINRSDLDRKNTVIVATPDEIDPSFADEVVQAPDGSIRFVMVKTE